MNKIKIIVFALACCVSNYLSAHSSQISTITITKKDTLWSLHISSSFDAFYYELTKKYPQTDFNKISKEALTDLLIHEVGNSIDMVANKKGKIVLQNGAVQVGHQTDLWFDIKGMSKDLKQLSIQAHTFSNIKQHNYILLMPKNETYEKFILGASNDNAMNFEWDNTQVFKQIPIESKNSMLYFGLLGIVAFGVFILLINFKTKKMNFKKIEFPKWAFGAVAALSLFSCSKTDDTTTTTTTTSTEVPAVYKKIYGATSITSDGTWIYIKSKDLPDHKSPYYPTSNALYEAFSGTTFNGVTFSKNPNSIVEQSATIKIPLNPKVDAAHSATSLGVIGVAINGVALFNQYAAGGAALTGEIGGFDKYYGHPQNTGVYHYHVEPLYLTTVKSTKAGLMGFMLDGFPIYGPQEEDGTTVTSSLLDVYHGHTHKTVDYPNGIYHYHFTADSPYLNGSGFYGTPGTVTQ